MNQPQLRIRVGIRPSHWAPFVAMWGAFLHHVAATKRLLGFMLDLVGNKTQYLGVQATEHAKTNGAFCTGSHALWLFVPPFGSPKHLDGKHIWDSQILCLEHIESFEMLLICPNRFEIRFWNAADLCLELGMKNELTHLEQKERY